MLLAVAPGCRKKAAPLDDTSRFALSVVEAARSPAGLGADLIDADLVEQSRRMQLVRRTTLDTWEADKLRAVLGGEGGPDRQYPVAERPQKQRERATRGLRATLDGACRASSWPAARDGRVRFLTLPWGPTLPDEVKAAQADLARRLAGAEAARVTCKTGDVVFLIVPGSDGKRRLVDIFPTATPNLVVSPNEPTMK